MVATTSYGQLKVFTNGDIVAGNNTGIAVPAETLEIVGEYQARGGNVIRTGASASTLFNRTDGAAMVMGSGVRSGYTWDETTNFEFRSAPRANVEAKQVTTGVIQMTIKGAGNGGQVGIGTTNPQSLLHVIGDVRATDYITISDKRLKTNIEDFTLGLDKVLEINPVSYKYSEKSGLRTDEHHVGVLAQEFQKIAPQSVQTYTHQIDDMSADASEKNSGEYLSVSTSTIQYMLVNAIKEQQALIEAQSVKIAQLEEAINTIGSTDATNRTRVTLSAYDLAELNQNTPNPFNGTTNISYVIPTDASSAQISIFGTSGQLVKTLDIEHVGQGNLEVNADDLPSGTYSYQLIVDGRSVKTSKMVLAK